MTDAKRALKSAQEFVGLIKDKIKREHPQINFKLKPSVDKIIFSWEKEATISDKSFAGTVIAPVSSTDAPTQKDILVSKLVVETLRYPLSVSNKTLDNIGSCVLDDTSLVTKDKLLFKFSCNIVAFILIVSILVVVVSSAR